MIAFLILILPIFLISLIININSQNELTEEISHSMNSRVEFYFQLLEDEIERMQTMQREFINDRNIKKLTDLETVISDMERRESLLATHNRLIQMRNSSYIEEMAIILPESRKVVSAGTVYSDMSQKQYDDLLAVAHKGRSLSYDSE